MTYFKIKFKTRNYRIKNLFPTETLNLCNIIINNWILNEDCKPECLKPDECKTCVDDCNKRGGGPKMTKVSLCKKFI